MACIETQLDGNFQGLKDKYFETVEKLNIKNRMKNWMKDTKEWIQSGILKKLIRLDLDNWRDLCKVLAKFRYSLVYSKDDFYNKETRTTIPYEYDKVFKSYYNTHHKLLDLDDILGIRK